MEKVINLVIAELEKPFENSQQAFMCNIANFLRNGGEITHQQSKDFKELIERHRPIDAYEIGYSVWWPMEDSDKRINFLKELLTKI